MENFETMTLPQKIKKIEEVVQREIRPSLQADGGDMEVIDIKETFGQQEIYIRYLGACGSCPSSSGGTLFAIQGTLQELVHPNIKVLPV